MTHKKHVVKNNSSEEEEDDESFELSATDKGALAIALLLAGYGIYTYRDELGNLVSKKKAQPAPPGNPQETKKEVKEGRPKRDKLSFSEMQAAVKKMASELATITLDYALDDSAYLPYAEIRFHPKNWNSTDLQESWIRMTYDPNNPSDPASFSFEAVDPNRLNGEDAYRTYSSLRKSLVQSIIIQQNATLESTCRLIKSYVKAPSGNEDKKEAPKQGGPTKPLGLRETINARIPALRSYDLVCEDLTPSDSPFKTIRFQPDSWSSSDMRNVWIHITCTDNCSTSDDLLQLEIPGQSKTLDAELVHSIITQKQVSEADTLQLIQKYIEKKKRLDAKRKLQMVTDALDNKFSFDTQDTDRKGYFCFHLATYPKSDWCFGLKDPNLVYLLNNDAKENILITPKVFSRLVQTLVQNQGSHTPLQYRILSQLVSKEREISAEISAWLPDHGQIIDMQHRLSLASFEHVTMKKVTSNDCKQFPSFFYLYALGHLENLLKQTGKSINKLGVFPRAVEARMLHWRRYLSEGKEQNLTLWQAIVSPIYASFFSAFLKQTSIHRSLLQDLNYNDNNSIITALSYNHPHLKPHTLTINAQGKISDVKQQDLQDQYLQGQYQQAKATLFGIDNVQLYIQSPKK